MHTETTETQRSLQRRGRIGHYVTGAYRKMARPVATQWVLAQAHWLNWVWGMDEVSTFLQRQPRRYIAPLVRAFGATLGDDITFSEGLEIRNGIHDFFRPLTIGKKVFLGYNVFIDLADSVTLEDYCIIGNHNRIICHIDPHHSPLKTHLYPVQFGQVRVGRGAFLGVNVTLLHGVTIGENSVIGANSLVTQDIPPYCLAVGTPAKVIRQLDASQIGTFES